MRSLTYFLLIVASAACSDAAVAPETPTGAALGKALNGAWCVSDDNGKTCWGWDVFLDGQTVESCGRFPGDGRAFRARAKFGIEGTTTCYEVTESNDSTTFPVGLKFCTKVLEINQEYQRYKVDGIVEKTYRVPSQSVSCPSDA